MAKKVVITVLLVTVLAAVSLTACDWFLGLASGEKRTEVVEKPVEAASEVKPVVANLVAMKKVNELEVVKVSEEYAERVGGIYLKRNGELYSTYKIPTEAGKVHDLGLTTVSGDSVALYQFGADERLLALGDFPILEFSNNDEMIGFGTETLELYPAEFEGWSLRLLEYSYDPRVMILARGGEKPIRLDQEAWQQLAVRDRDGNDVTKRHDLAFMEKYVVSWREEGGPRRLDMVANCRCYKVRRDASEFLMLGRRIENYGEDVYGFSWYDLGGIPAGTYYITDANETSNGIVLGLIKISKGVGSAM